MQILNVKANDIKMANFTKLGTNFFYEKIPLLRPNNSLYLFKIKSRLQTKNIKIML